MRGGNTRFVFVGQDGRVTGEKAVLDLPPKPIFVLNFFSKEVSDTLKPGMPQGNVREPSHFWRDQEAVGSENPQRRHT